MKYRVTGAQLQNEFVTNQLTYDQVVEKYAVN
jgi:hypothetical protein